MLTLRNNHTVDKFALVLVEADVDGPTVDALFVHHGCNNEVE